MRAFLYGAALQWRLDIHSKSLLITCYLVPLLFFVLMGGIFTSLTPDVTQTLIPSMTHEGTRIGRSETHIRRLCPAATVRSGVPTRGSGAAQPVRKACAADRGAGRFARAACRVHGVSGGRFVQPVPVFSVLRGAQHGGKD